MRRPSLGGSPGSLNLCPLTPRSKYTDRGIEVKEDYAGSGKSENFFLSTSGVIMPLFRNPWYLPPSAKPTYFEAMYKRPNPDGTRKSCAGCIMYVKGENKCVIHPKDLTVRSFYFCDYHVFGMSMEKWMDHPGMMAVDPAFSGLRLAGGGLACDNCIFYAPGEPQAGICTALVKVLGGTELAPVAALAMCARHGVS